MAHRHLTAGRLRSAIRRHLPRLLLAVAAIVAAAFSQTSLAADSAGVAESLKGLNAKALPDALSAEQLQTAGDMVPNDIRARRQGFNDLSTSQWRQIKDLAAWEKFRDERIAALEASLGQYPEPPAKITMHVTGKIDGDGFVIENIVFESRPGLWVTANLYRPAKPGKAMPGMLIFHAHHTPKTHGELQDMGMTWARGGCVMLIMDQIGHGERRGHPFRSAADYKDEYPVSRQDYHFRYDNGMKLHTLGDSLMGWMAYDMRRAVDLLLAYPGIDKNKIILFGSVAGGGDPAAVTAALDKRISCAVPFNFGGPQPETRFPLPEDVEISFNYAGGGSWESTRNLTASASGGFLPWVIVGAIAPRPLIFSHEFAWHQERDPVWKRLETIYTMYGARENLSFTHGRGSVKLRPPEATHCTHIGAVHRQMIHPALQKWFDIPVGVEQEYSQRLMTEQLMAMTPEMNEKLHPRPLPEIFAQVGSQRASAARKQLASLSPDARKQQLCDQWSQILGKSGNAAPKVLSTKSDASLTGAKAERIVLEVESGILVPAVVLSPAKAAGKRPVVVMVAQEGKEKLLAARAEAIGELLAGGAAVCLPDVRGTGETSFGSDRGRQSYATGLSSSELMLGGTMVGLRLADLRSVLAYLRTRKDVDPAKIALWGDSLAEANPADTDYQIPRGIGLEPRESEPLGGLLALLGGLYEDGVAAVYVRGGLGSFQSVLDGYYACIPHDVVVPGALTTGDLADVAATLAPRPLRLDDAVDGLNRTLSASSLTAAYAPATASYRQAKAVERLSLGVAKTSPAAWLLAEMK